MGRRLVGEEVVVDGWLVGEGVYVGKGGEKKGARTEVVGQAGYGARHVCLRCLLRPPVLQVAVPADDGEARAEGGVEARGADDSVDLENLARFELDTLRHKPFDPGSPYVDIRFCQGLEIAVPGGHSPCPERVVRYEHLAEVLVPSEHGRHVLSDFCSREGLDGALCEDLEAC